MESPLICYRCQKTVTWKTAIQVKGGFIHPACGSCLERRIAREKWLEDYRRETDRT